MNTETENKMPGAQNIRENLPLGTIGALIGVLLGMTLWVIVGLFRFIAGIAGYAIVFGAMKGYKLLGKKLSKAGIVICVLLSIVAVLGGEMLSLAITVYTELGVPLGDAFLMLPDLLQEPELVGAVVKDLAVGYALSIWACYSPVKEVWSQTGEKQG